MQLVAVSGSVPPLNVPMIVRNAGGHHPAGSNRVTYEFSGSFKGADFAHAKGLSTGLLGSINIAKVATSLALSFQSLYSLRDGITKNYRQKTHHA